MSEVFDPEKVDRLTNVAISALYIADKLELGDEFVSAADYDKLLALYEEPTAESLLEYLYTHYAEDGPFTHKTIRSVIDSMKSLPPEARIAPEREPRRKGSLLPNRPFLQFRDKLRIY